MRYSPLKHNKRVFEEHQLKQHVKILRELPQDANGRVANAHHRHEILKANKMYQLRIERDRANAAIASLPVNAQVTYVSCWWASAMTLAKQCCGSHEKEAYHKVWKWT